MFSVTERLVDGVQGVGTGLTRHRLKRKRYRTERYFLKGCMTYPHLTHSITSCTNILTFTSSQNSVL